MSIDPPELTDAEGKRLPRGFCPVCGYTIDAATPTPNEPTYVRPRPGDVSLCFKCGEALILGDDLRLRRADLNDLLTLDDTQRIAIGKAQRLIRSLRREK